MIYNYKLKAHRTDRYLEFSYDETSNTITGKDKKEVQELVDHIFDEGYLSFMPCANYPFSPPLTLEKLSIMLSLNWDVSTMPMPDISDFFEIPDGAES